MEGPKVWMNGKATLGVHHEPRSQTTDYLQVAKSGWGSYFGHYGGVWSNADLDGRCVPWQDVRELISDDLKDLLSDPYPRLYLEFIDARYTPDKQLTDIRFSTELTLSVRRWVPAEAHRTGTAHCRSDDQDGCRVKWDNGRFAEATTHLGFTLVADTSPLRAPFVVMEWRQPNVKLLMLFKKQANTAPEQLTKEERARLGIGMTYQDMVAAYTLSTLREERVVADNRTADRMGHAPVKPALRSETGTIQRRRSRIGLQLQ